MHMHGLGQWRSLPRIPLRDGLHLHQGLWCSRLRPRRARAGLRTSVGAQDGARGQATGAVTAHNGHGGTRAAWGAALVRSRMRWAMAPRCWEPMAAHRVRS
jgi:hypothetical protein